MKKLWLVFIFILLFAASCSINPASNSDPELDKNPVPEESVIMQTENYEVKKVEFFISGFKPIQVKWLDDENIAVHLVEDPQTNRVERTYVYNLKNKHHNLIFEGTFLGDGDWSMKVKQLLDGNFLLEGSKRALEIEKESFQLKEIISYPEGAYEGAISHNRRQLLYNKEEGLYLHALNSSSSQDTALYKYDDEKEIRPIEPRWSFDDKKIAYTLFHRKDLSLNEIIIFDPVNKKQKAYNVGKAAAGWWFQDNIRFVVYTSSPWHPPVITVIDTDKDQAQEYEKTGEISIDSPPYGDQILYLHMDSEIKNGYFMDRIVNFNVATNKDDVVTPDFLNIRSASFSPSGNEVLFIANINPGEPLSIYIAKRK